MIHDFLRVLCALAVKFFARLKPLREMPLAFELIRALP
jgi:hypothetical protein